MTTPHLNLAEIEAAAKERLTSLAYEYYFGGANDEVTVRENRAAFERLAIRYRVLVDVSTRSTKTTVLGTPIDFPVLVAPTAFQRLACDDGELATARAASARAARRDRRARRRATARTAAAWPDRGAGGGVPGAEAAALG